jgi:hypothetical protein
MEPIGRRQMLLQEMFFESEVIHGFDHCFEEFCKRCDHLLQFGVEWIAENFVIQIPHQVDEAPLPRPANVSLALTGLPVNYSRAYG